jgi:hypothetical protein
MPLLDAGRAISFGTKSLNTPKGSRVPASVLLVFVRPKKAEEVNVADQNKDFGQGGSQQSGQGQKEQQQGQGGQQGGSQQNPGQNPSERGGSQQQQERGNQGGSQGGGMGSGSQGGSQSGQGGQGQRDQNQGTGNR